MKVTPLLVVDEIEGSLPFWVDRLGFAKTVEVPSGDRLGFVILVSDGAELMLQTLDSVRQDTGSFVPEARGHSATLFLEVQDFGDLVKRLGDYPIALPERTTFYGMREIGVLAPSGHPVMFGARAKD